jgi:uncharacterized coiled-coil protein SlyX
MSTLNDADSLSFPHPVLTRLHAPGKKPTRPQILQVQLELNANAATIDSIHGPHGHSFLTIAPADYTVLNGGVVFVIPAKPPIEPVYANAAPTAFQISEAVRQHAAAWRTYRLIRKTESSLRNQLLAAADDVYWRRMRLPTLGYATRTIRELLDHLLTTYGRFTDAERQAVASRLEIPWEGGPLEIVIQQIEDAADALKLGGAEMTAPQKRDKLYDLVNNSGLVPDACQKWRMKAPNDKTWDSATELFLQHANDRDEMLTSGKAGYSANHMMEETLTATRDILQELNSQVANMSERTNTQASTITTLTAKLAASDATLKAYRDGTKHLGKENNGQGYHPPATRSRGKAFGTKYCWTHGCRGHESNACKNKANGHKDAATLNNTMGGSDFIT